MIKQMGSPPQWLIARDQPPQEENVIRLRLNEDDPSFEALKEQERAEISGWASELASFSLVDFLDEDCSALSFVVDGIIPRGDVTVFAAKSGIGKSFLMLQTVLSVGAGQPFLG